MSISRLANTYTLSGYREQILANAVHLFPRIAASSSQQQAKHDQQLKIDHVSPTNQQLGSKSRSNPFDVIVTCKNEGTWSNKNNWRAYLVFSDKRDAASAVGDVRTAASGCFKTSELLALGSLLSVLGAALRERKWEIEKERKRIFGEGEIDGSLLEAQEGKTNGP